MKTSVLIIARMLARSILLVFTLIVLIACSPSYQGFAVDEQCDPFDDKDPALQGLVFEEDWAFYVKQQIQAKWRKPISNNHSKQDCVLQIKVNADGCLLAVDVGQCKGSNLFRNSMMQAVIKAAPFPPPPGDRIPQEGVLLRFFE
ncbi:MAG: TonB C-terminal domain-containing protein [Gammaproteobacteria bacterium]|nr:TonB C-terminal domain-containing protein [Gammaproteobacteria bacterium]MDH5730745.1 TonB C-terminal domain-containing protein [Gammaproteobacteria bacterium]